MAKYKYPALSIFLGGQLEGFSPVTLLLCSLWGHPAFPAFQSFPDDTPSPDPSCICTHSLFLTKSSSYPWPAAVGEHWGPVRKSLHVRFNPWVRKIPWRKAWQPTPVFLPGESPRTEEPDWLQSVGSQRVGRDWSDLACRHLSLQRTLSLCVFNCCLYSEELQMPNVSPQTNSRFPIIYKMPSLEFIYKTEIRVTEIENKQGFQGRKGGLVGDWDWHIHSATYKIGN